MTAKEGKHNPVLTATTGYSWCCRMPVVQVGKHFECSECGAANACDTEHNSVDLSRHTKPMDNEKQYIAELTREAA